MMLTKPGLQIVSMTGIVTFIVTAKNIYPEHWTLPFSIPIENCQSRQTEYLGIRKNPRYKDIPAMTKVIITIMATFTSEFTRPTKHPRMFKVHLSLVSCQQATNASSCSACQNT